MKHICVWHHPAHDCFEVHCDRERCLCFAFRCMQSDTTLTYDRASSFPPQRLIKHSNEGHARMMTGEGGGGLLRRRRRMMIILQQLETDYVRRDPTVTNHTHQHTQATLQFKCVVPAVRVVYTAWRCWAQQRVCSGQTRSQGDAFISRRCCRACSEQLLPRQM